MDDVSGLAEESENFASSEQLLENIDTAVFLVFIQYFQKRQFGDYFYLKETFIFFLQHFLYLALKKF